MSIKVENHKHCKICGEAIEIYGGFNNIMKTYLKLEICEKCIIEKGIEAVCTKKEGEKDEH